MSEDLPQDRLPRLALRVAGARAARLEPAAPGALRGVAGDGGLAGSAAADALCARVLETGERVVADEGAVAFAGVPLSSGGVLAVLADAPRAWSPGELAALADVAALAALAGGPQERRAEAELQRVEQQLRTVVASAPMALGLLDADGTYRLAEGLSIVQMGLRPEQVVGRSFRRLWRDAPHVVAALERALTGEAFSEEVEVNGRTFDLSFAPLLDADGRLDAVISVAVDISARRRSERQLEHLAYHDALTGLPNRSHLQERLSQVLGDRRADGGTAALLFLDIDQFKVVNDTLGHAAGDELLCEIGRRLQGAVRRSDLVARHGGDEFIVLLDDLGGDPVAAAEEVARKLLDALARDFSSAGGGFDVGASIGISTYPRDGEYGEELLRKADTAMYAAKRGGRGAWAVYAAGQSGAPERLTLTSRLRRALDRDELLLEFQPVWDLQDERVVGVESLVRWEDPERGRIPPLSFIAHAEEHGLIDRVGDRVIEHACAQAAVWAAAGTPTRVGFNVAPRQLRRPGFVEDLVATAARHGVDPRTLTVEITESAARAEPQTVLRVLHTLGEAGVTVAIDDFGAGHSSLARLRELPVWSLKLDGLFLTGVPHDPGAAAIVVGVLGLAASLGLRGVAEGIETAEQLAFLVASGCRYGQGFHLARPLGAAEVSALLPRSSPADLLR